MTFCSVIRYDQWRQRYVFSLWHGRGSFFFYIIYTRRFGKNRPAALFSTLFRARFASPWSFEPRSRLNRGESNKRRGRRMIEDERGWSICGRALCSKRVQKDERTKRKKKKTLEKRTRGMGIRENACTRFSRAYAPRTTPATCLPDKNTKNWACTPADRHRLACLWRSIEKIRLTRARIVSTGRRDINLISKPRFDVYEVRARIHPRDWNAALHGGGEGVAEIKSSRKNKGSPVPAGYHVPSSFW